MTTSVAAGGGVLSSRAAATAVPAGLQARELVVPLVV